MSAGRLLPSSRASRLGNDLVEIGVDAREILAGVRVSDAGQVRSFPAFEPIVALEDCAQLVMRDAEHARAVDAGHGLAPRRGR